MTMGFAHLRAMADDVIAPEFGLGVLYGQVVPEDVGWGGPSERSIGAR